MDDVVIKSYCLVQEDPADKQQLLGLLLSIELYHPYATCVVSCTEEAKDYIEKFSELKYIFPLHILSLEHIEKCNYIKC